MSLLSSGDIPGVDLVESESCITGRSSSSSRSWSSQRDSVSEEAARPPFSLSKLSRSPTSILYNRSRTGLNCVSPEPLNSTYKVKKKLPSGTRNLEAEISARLAFVEIIRSLQKENEQHGNLDTGTAGAAMIQQYQAMLEEERKVTRRLEDRYSKMQVLRTRLQSLTTQRFEEEKRHAQTIRMFSKWSPSPPSSMFSTPPPVPEATNLSQPSRGAFFSSLMSLSGQLAEYCSGGQGSRLVEDRIRHGSSQERNLLWSELGLPSSLLSILLTGNNNFIKVVLALAQVDQQKREAIKREISKSKKNVENINPRFLEDIEKLV